MWRLLNIFFYSSTKRKQHKIKVDHLQSESFSYNKLSKDNMHRLCPLQLLRGSKHEAGGWLYTCLPIFCCLNVKQCPWLSPWRPAHCVNVYLLFSFKYHSRNWDLPQSPVPFPLTETTLHLVPQLIGLDRHLVVRLSSSAALPPSLSLRFKWPFISTSGALPDPSRH